MTAIDTPTRSTWLAAARELLDRIERTQGDAVEEASRLCAGAIAHDGLVHLFGTGHSRIPVEEMFPRYGSYPGFHPIVELSMTYHTEVVGANGQRQAMFIERTEGLAAVILANFTLRPSDVMMIFSASGLTAVPIEVAMEARARESPWWRSRHAPSRSPGRPSTPRGSRLLDHADIVLDLCTPPADALVSLDGVPTPVGPGIIPGRSGARERPQVRVAELLAADGNLPPVLTSSTVVGAKESRRLFDAAYAEHARRVAHVLRGAGDL